MEAEPTPPPSVAIAEIGLCRRIRSDNGQRSPGEAIKFRAMDDRAATPASGLYHGWFVVVAAFFVALFGFGLGFYGPGVYLVALKASWLVDRATLIGNHDLLCAWREPSIHRRRVTV